MSTLRAREHVTPSGGAAKLVLRILVPLLMMGGCHKSSSGSSPPPTLTFAEHMAGLNSMSAQFRTLLQSGESADQLRQDLASFMLTEPHQTDVVLCG